MAPFAFVGNLGMSYKAMLEKEEEERLREIRRREQEAALARQANAANVLQAQNQMLGQIQDQNNVIQQLNQGYAQELQQNVENRNRIDALLREVQDLRRLINPVPNP